MWEKSLLLVHFINEKRLALFHNRVKINLPLVYFMGVLNISFIALIKGDELIKVKIKKR